MHPAERLPDPCRDGCCPRCVVEGGFRVRRTSRGRAALCGKDLRCARTKIGFVSLVPPLPKDCGANIRPLRGRHSAPTGPARAQQPVLQTSWLLRSLAEAPPWAHVLVTRIAARRRPCALSNSFYKHLGSYGA